MKKVNATGRSTGSYTSKEKKIFGPPKDEPWVWEPVNMKASPAWKALGINARRFIDFLEIEHRNHGGRENGNLKATYDQLVSFGLSRSEIKSAIDEVVIFGFVKVIVQGGRWANSNQPSVYRLTFYASRDANPPSNEWKGKTEEAIKRWKKKRTRKRKTVAQQKQRRKEADRKKLNHGAGSRTTVVLHPALSMQKQEL